jgi:hypothetical protein
MADIDERYQRGRIYTIRCRYDDSLIYVGSTIDKLAKRMSNHRLDKKCSLSKLVNGDWNNWYIELYEEYPCNNKEQLEKREGEVIREIATINKNIAGRTRKEWCEENHDEIREQKKKYHQDNRDEILEKMKKYHQDNRDEILEQKKKYHQDNRDEILEKKKKYRQVNRDKLLEKAKEKCKCDVCGVEIVKVYLKRHQRTAKCMNANK